MEDLKWRPEESDTPVVCSLRNKKLMIDSSIPEEEYQPNAYAPAGVMDEIVRIARSLPANSIIAFHGSPGSGKSASARWVSKQLGITPFHLDNYPAVGPDGFRNGFNENDMRAAIDDVHSDKLRIVEGICACRVCAPALLVKFGYWNISRASASLKSFIGSYDPDRYRGSTATLHANFHDELFR
jgi:hypothetical protein